VRFERAIRDRQSAEQVIGNVDAQRLQRKARRVRRPHRSEHKQRTDSHPGGRGFEVWVWLWDHRARVRRRRGLSEGGFQPSGSRLSALRLGQLTFAKDASLEDPARLFNSSLDGRVRRAIDIHEGEEVDGSAFKALVRQAVALNRSGKSGSSKQGMS
jgi:hypothetical protein